MRRRLVQLILQGAGSAPASRAMRALLDIEHDVDACIDQAALKYGEGIHVKHRLIRYHEFFVARIRPGERVLDVGFGWGAVAHAMAEAGATVIGIDSSAERVSESRARFQHPRLEFVAGTAPDDVPAQPFDVIVASNVLEHVERRIEFLRTIQERTSATRWLIRVPMADRHWHVPMRSELGLFPFSDPTHFTEYTRGSFERELDDAGFVIDHLQVNWGEIWAEVHYVD
jgi:SAM-dependent methyltransferase